MERKELETRITKKEEQIKKIEKRIAKWRDSKNETEFLKKDGWLLNMGRDRVSLYNDYLRDCDEEIRRATRDLEDATVQLKKYQNMLQVEEAKDNKLENDRIDVIWNFLLNYKENVKEYIRNNLQWLVKYYEYNSKACDWHNKNAWKVRAGEMSKEEYNKVYNELNSLEKEAKENIHPYTYKVARKNYTTNERYIDEEELEKILLKDITSRYFRLINQVTKHVGKITDASNLKMGMNGDLNGYIEGEDGKAKVETISAGGYNIQCFHYRVLVHKIN